MIFKHFPLIQYDGIVTRDITRHIKMIDRLEEDPYVYLPYTLRDGESPEDVSYFYYDAVRFVPFVLMANNIVDPYIDWFMSNDVFQKYIIKKYEAKSGLTGDQVLYWSMNQTNFDNVVHFENQEGDIKTLDTAIIEFVPESEQPLYLTGTNKNLPLFDVPGYSPVRVHEYEESVNESKRRIRLIDKVLIRDIEIEFIRKVKL